MHSDSSDTSTQKLIDDDLTTSDYKTNYSEPTRTTAIEKKYKCSNCESLFINKQTLQIHQKTSIKCMKNDNSSSSSSSSDSMKKCEFCDKIFASKQMRLYHESKCVEKIVQELKKEHRQEILKLENTIKSLQLEIRK